MFKVTHNLAPISFANTWPSNIQVRNRLPDQDHQLRNDDILFTPFSRTEYLSKFPLFLYPKLWNAISPELKLINSKAMFISKIKLHFLNNYDTNYRCTRLLCPLCHFAN
jgi:hypothetical protein